MNRLSLAALAIRMAAAQMPAFPGAGGIGAGTPGGRVLVVTTLADSGPGSPRVACEAAGPRIVVFAVSGIDLKSELQINAARVTAPGIGNP